MTKEKNKEFHPSKADERYEKESGILWVLKYYIYCIVTLLKRLGLVIPLIIIIIIIIVYIIRHLTYN
jgi:hypothetical protein